MTAKPTAVVVRLPLSEENLTAFITSMDCGEGAEEALLAIGTPVAGGELEVVAYSYENEAMGFWTNREVGYGPKQWVQNFYHKHPDTLHGPGSTRNIRRLVSEDDAQAALAAAQAEIGRLNAKQPHYDRMVQENGELKLAVTHLQSQDSKALTQVIEERDECEQVIADLYQAVMDDAPEWSNSFGYRDAVEEVSERVYALRTKARKGPAA